MSTQLLLAYDFPPLGGGIARWMGELATRYPAGSLVVSTGNHPADVVSDAYPNRVDRLPVPAERLRTLYGLFLWSRRAARLAISYRAEFIWCGNLKPAGYPARWVHARLGVPYGILVHGGDLLILQRQARQSLRKRRAARALFRAAAVLVANSDWTRDLCRSILDQLEIDAGRDKVRTVPLGSDPVLFRPGMDQTEVRSRYGLNGRRWLLTVARLTRHKGIDTGIRVLAMLRERYPDLGYAVVGSGDQRAALASLASELGVGDRVRFLLGVTDRDLPALYNTASVYLGLSRLMPDRVEGFGISLLEAGASGLPVVAGRTGGIPDAVRDGETGLLVNPDNLDEVCGAIRGLLDDPGRAASMGQAGRQAVETYYNWDRVAADLFQIGHELASRSTGRSYAHDD
jgi:phosphatidylinositol alpha-1,6-mannosyltransferase